MQAADTDQDPVSQRFEKQPPVVEAKFAGGRVFA
jgi:hypothetical protein